MAHPLLSEALKEAYASASTEVEVIDAIAISDEAGTELYICSGNIERPLQVTPGIYRTFKPYPFRMSKKLGVSDKGAASITVDVENVDGTVATFLRAMRVANRTIYVTLLTYLSDSDLPQNTRPVVLELTSANLTLSGASITASVPDIVNKAFPNAYYSYTAYPGLRG